MTNILLGKAVSDNICEKLKEQISLLNSKDVIPCLAIVRCGEKANDLSYEKSLEKKCEELNIKVKKVVCPLDITEDDYLKKIKKLNKDKKVHGILVFRPLPKQINDRVARNSINIDKDVDGCSDLSLAGVYTNQKLGFAPCTAEACVKILDFYNIPIESKNVCVLGRSLVIGKPVSMLLSNRNATVTICHSKSLNVCEITKKADIIICATGQMESIGKEYIGENQTIIDVGLNFNEQKGKLCGDAKYDEICDLVSNITPVPRGVGSVTTSVLLSHVVENALKEC